MKSAVAVILARAGSKGVAGKNTRMLAGKPCIAWTLEHALQSRLVGLVAVSSDDEHALTIAREHGAIALHRPHALATDTARVDDAARDAVLRIEPMFSGEQHAGTPPPIVILYANVPVRPDDLADRALETLMQTGCDSVQSYAPVGKLHPWWLARIDEERIVRPWEGDVLYHGVYRRQDLPPVHAPDGGVIALTRRALFCEVPGVKPGPHAFLGADRRGIITAEGSVVDIDTEIDMHVAEAVLNSRDAESVLSARPRDR